GVESHTLGPAQTAIEHIDFAGVRYAVDGIEAGSGRATHIEITIGAECQMVGGDRRFDGGEDEDLALRADLGDRAAAIADVHVALVVEGETGSDTHAFDPNRDCAVRSGLVHDAVEAAGDVQHAIPIEGQAARVHQIVDEGLDVVIQIDLVDRDGHFLAARSAEGGKNIAEGVDGGVRHRVQAVGDRDADI